MSILAQSVLDTFRNLLRNGRSGLCFSSCHPCDLVVKMHVPGVVLPLQWTDSSSFCQKQHSFDEAEQQAAEQAMNQALDESKEAGSLQQSTVLGNPPSSNSRTMPPDPKKCEGIYLPQLQIPEIMRL